MGLDHQGSITGSGSDRTFSPCHRAQIGSGAYPACYSSNTGGSYPRVKRLRHEDDHELPSSAEVNNTWSYIFAAPIRLHGVTLN
jgi:hypothetical protein